jgi:hypothetical protein
MLSESRKNVFAGSKGIHALGETVGKMYLEGAGAFMPLKRTPDRSAFRPGHFLVPNRS